MTAHATAAVNVANANATAAAVANNNAPTTVLHYGLGHNVAELSGLAIGNSFPIYTVLPLPDTNPTAYRFVMSQSAPANTVLRLLYGHAANDGIGIPIVLPDKSATEHIDLREHVSLNMQRSSIYNCELGVFAYADGRRCIVIFTAKNVMVAEEITLPPFDEPVKWFNVVGHDNTVDTETPAVQPSRVLVRCKPTATPKRPPTSPRGPPAKRARPAGTGHLAKKTFANKIDEAGRREHAAREQAARE